MKTNKWIKRALLWIFVYIPALALIISGFSFFGLGITILSGLLLITHQEIRTYIHTKGGFKNRVSRLPLITEEPTQNNAIFLTLYLLVLSFISWLILGSSHTFSLGIDILLSLAGIVLFYGYFVEGWFLPGGDQDISDDDKLASLIPKLSISTITSYIKSNLLIAIALISALLSPVLCVGTGELLLDNSTESSESITSQQELKESNLGVKQATQTPYVVVITSTSLPKTSTSTAEPTTTSTQISEMVQALVTEIIDGDTIHVLIDGEEFPVRYIGIDTPEVQYNEWYGKEARDANIVLVAGKEVLLEKDVSETDQYDRLLRYVYLLDGTFVNAELIRLGFAVAKAYPPDTKYHDQLESLEQEAINSGLGLWQATPTPQTVQAPPSNTSVEIIAVNKGTEYVDIQNVGSQAISIDGWTLRSEKGNQDCGLSGNLAPGEVLRIWALAEDSDEEGFNCWYGTNIWNNSKTDPAVLYDETFAEVDRYP